MYSTFFLLFVTFFLGIAQLSAQKQIQKQIQNDLIMVENGDTIFLPEGKFDLSATLSMDEKSNIIIIGKGQDKTILSFKNQTSGAEGLRISDSKNIRLIDFTIEDAKGDCIKVQKTDGIAFINVTAQWTGKPSKKNGAYAFYPVQCNNVLIDNCFARGASDAGVYVGQSKNIIVRKCTATENVAGIEIENSSNADVCDNKAYNNTGGILIFDLPDLLVKRGGNVRVFDNEVIDNNYKNFAPKGNIVASVPQGTGVMLLAAHNVEIFNNKIHNNRSLGVGIISYYMTERPLKDTAYYAYPTEIHIHDNDFKRKKRTATRKGRFGLIARFKLKMGKNVPHIIFDGILDKELPKNNGHQICIHNNKDESFFYMDAANGFKNKSRDITPFTCKLPALNKIKVD